MQIRLPLLIDIRKDQVTAKEQNASAYYSGDLTLWTSKDAKNLEVVKAIGNEGIQEGQKHKIFYNNPSMLIDDPEKANTAMRWLLLKSRPKNQPSLFKPIVIVNVPYPLTPVEIKSLNDVLISSGAREVIMMNQENLPLDQLLKPNFKIPGNIVSGEDRYTTDDSIILVFAAIISLLAFFVYKNLI